MIDCLECGQPFPGGAFAGNCPVCLARRLLNPPTDADAATDLEPALRQLGELELVEELGRGGMGIIFRARQVGLGREVAVKLMRDGALAQPQDVRRFRAEAAAVAKLKHPAIVPIYEAGEADGQPYLVMELVEGRDLAEMTREAPLATRVAAGLVVGVADAVQHAHQQNILHRDLKPSNVLVDAEGRPRVTDFGLARPLEGNDPITLTGQVLGTPGYLAPEQAQGAMDIGPAADVYGLGSILFHLLTGRAPFVGSSVAETMAQVLHNEPLSPRLLNPSVPQDLASVCLKCLAKRPGERYPSAAAVAEDLGRFLRGESTLARPAGPITRLMGWARRKPALAAAMAFALITLSLGLTLSTWQWRRAVHAVGERQEQLWHSQLLEARSHRISREPGQRIEALQTLRHAAAFRPSLELRNEAIAALLLPDLGPKTNWHAVRLPHGPLAYTGDFKFCSTHRRDGRLVVLDALDAAPVAEMPGTNAEITWLQFSPDDRWLGAGFRDGVVQVWDWRRRELRQSWRTTSTQWNRPVLDFTPEGGGVIRALGGRLERSSFDREPGSRMLLTNALEFVRISPSGNHVACFGEATLELWRLEPPQLLARHEFASTVAAVAWHPHEETVVTGTDANGFFVWDFMMSPPRQVGSVHAAVTHVFFNPLGDLLVASGWGDVTEIWDTRDWTLLLRTSDGFGKHLSRDGRWMALVQEGSGFGIRAFLEPKGLRHWNVPPSLEAPTESARFSRDGRWLATAHHGGWLLWDARRGRIAARRPGNQVQSCEFAGDGSAVYTCDAAGVKRWPIRFEANLGQPDLGPPETLLTNGPPEIDRVALTQDNLKLVAVGEGAGAVLDLKTGQKHEIGDWSRRRAHWLAISPDGAWLATSHHHATNVYVYRLGPTPQFVTNLPTGGGRFAFRTDGKVLAAGAREALTLWDVGTWRFLARWPSEPISRVADVAGYSPDGGLLWVNRADRRIGLRDPNDGSTLASFVGAIDNLAWAVVYDPSGRRCAATSARPALGMWQLDELRVELRDLGLDWSQISDPR